jgi:ADP-ribose pyrophosphatase
LTQAPLGPGREPEPWITQSTRTAYENPWMLVTEHDVLLPTGRTIFYGVTRLGDCVGVLPFVDERDVLMVRQWRYILDRATWEMPTGGCLRDEDPLVAAQREMAEEVGHRAGRLVPIGSFNSSKSVVDETAHLYLGYDLEPDPTGVPDETELITVEAVPFTTVLQWVLDGDIVDAMTIIAVLRAQAMRTGR